MNGFRRGNILPLFLALAATGVLLFPTLIWFPQGTENLDNSWVWSLRYATEHHLQWGTDYIFTYGPLGYLDDRCFYGGYSIWVVSALFALFSLVVSLQVLVQGCLKSVDQTGAATRVCELIFCVLLISVCQFEPQTAIFMTAYGLICFSFVQGSSITRALIIAFLLALSSQIKATAFIGAFALIGTNLAACFLLRDRQKLTRGIVLAAAYPFFSLLLWVISGQGLTHLPAYIHGTFDLAGGYSKIMAIDGYCYQIVVAGLFTGLYLFATGLGWWRNRVQLALFLVTGPVLFLFWKEGFVRQDVSIWGGHALQFFCAILYVFWIHYLAVKTYAPLARDFFLGGAIACLSFLYISVPSSIPAWNPTAAGSNVQSALQAAFFDDYNAAQEKINADLRGSYNIPPTVTWCLRPAPTVVLPTELILAPAYRLPLALPPVPQAYAIYTPYLDHADTLWLNKSEPEQVLYSYVAIDGHYPLFEGPEFNYHILRQYTVVANSATYAVMYRNHAEEPQIDWQGSPQTNHFDQEIILPETDAKLHLLMKVKLRRSFLGDIYGFFYKTARPTILFHLKDGTTQSFTFVYTTGEDGLLVSHMVDNLDQYVQLNKMIWAPNVHSVTFSVDKNLAWQFADSFPVEFGTSFVTEGPVQVTPPPQFADGSWSLQSSAHGEILSSSQQGQPLPVADSSIINGYVDKMIWSPTGSEVRLVGWAGSPASEEPCTNILVISGSQILKVAPVDQPRPDVGKVFRFPQPCLYGFDFTWPVSLLPGKSMPVRLFGFTKGKTAKEDRLVEIKYGALEAAPGVVVDGGHIVLTAQGASLK